MSAAFPARSRVEGEHWRGPVNHARLLRGCRRRATSSISDGARRFDPRPARQFAAFHEAVDLASRADAAQHRVNERWTVKDELAHVAAWAEEFEREVRHVADHGPQRLPWTVTREPDHSYDEWNEARRRELQPLSLVELAARYEACHRRLTGLLETLSEEQLGRITEVPRESRRLAIPQIIDIMVEHERGHLRRVRRTVDSRRT